MNQTLSSPEVLRASRELLLAGFQSGIESHIIGFPFQDVRYETSQTTDVEAACRWLEKRVESIETFQLPYAVLCDLQWLLATDFRLPHKMANHPELCNVPVIVMTSTRRAVEKSELVDHGVDDCYVVPVQWKQLEARLEFLNQFKSRMLEYGRKPEPQNWAMHIPLAKRLFDIVSVLCVLPLLLIPGLLVALAIRMESRGPIFYRSKRVGTGYRVFEFLKFRSMYQDADQRLKELTHLNQYNGDSMFVKLHRDPRVTRVGRFIRKYSIDELPQLLNILRGDMSVVGNRPLPLYEAELLTREEYCARFLAPAGLTGLWQVTKRGRSDMSASERIGLDLDYARQPYSVRRDLALVFRTFTAFVQKEDV